MTSDEFGLTIGLCLALLLVIYLLRALVWAYRDLRKAEARIEVLERASCVTPPVFREGSLDDTVADNAAIGLLIDGRPLASVTDMRTHAARSAARPALRVVR